jgi:hypothetical protein
VEEVGFEGWGVGGGGWFLGLLLVWRRSGRGLGGVLVEEVGFGGLLVEEVGFWGCFWCGGGRVGGWVGFWWRSDWGWGFKIFKRKIDLLHFLQQFRHYFQYW